ncbi:hypothetical protein SAMN05444007_112100 [Cribrihabitans marinus]|uniref:Tyr recombinase domain-containing protein n=1 Tax=Cribrihabitans marinus TaxID=1227549 RepID=A0A1H7DWD0_9RHOB|nr:hypothetical protein SAMN05444007_112100 [Cribrihabitans marinus]
MVWSYAKRGYSLDRQDPRIASVLAGIKRKNARPLARKQALLLLGYASGLRRSEVVQLDVGRDDTPGGGRSRIEILEAGAVLTLNARTGWREVEIGRGSPDWTYPVHVLEQWLHFAGIEPGPVFVRTSRDGMRALGVRLSDKHVARLVKQTMLRSGIRSDLSESERLALFSGHSLRADLARSAETPGRSQHRQSRVRVNLTKAAGL